MSFKSSKQNKPSRQPAILSRKRKAEIEIETSSPSDILSSPASYAFPSSCDNTPCTSSETESEDKGSPEVISRSPFIEFRGFASMIKSLSSHTCKRKSPLPELQWAEQKDLWHSLVLKDIVYPRDNKILKNHPELDGQMRAILLDWLSEVSEVYRLHRETYYLALDYINRFLLAKPNLPRNCLQLLGATALFVASKMEEIYAPKVEQFAFVTDGACTTEEILSQELVLIMTLNWSLTPVTAINWLNIFMQLAYIENGENFIHPGKFPKRMFVQICQILDLCTLDVESLKFSNSVLSASAIAHFISKETAMHVSGLGWDELLPCVTWLKPFIETAFEDSAADLKNFSDIPESDWHNIQTHATGLKLLEKAKQKQKVSLQELSPSTSLRQLTPPLRMLVGGFVGVLNMFPKWQIGVYSLIVGLIVFILEYPRSYRNDFKFFERRYQRCFVPCIVALGFCGRNFYIRSILYFCLSIPCFFLLPTFIGGACIITASLIYLIAARNGFEWKETPVKVAKSSAIDKSVTIDNFITLKETVC